MLTKFLRYAWLIVLMVSVSLACKAAEVGSDVEKAQATVQTGLEEGQQAVQTLQAVATQGAPMLATAQAFATQNAPLIATAQAIATEKGPEALETAQAAATQFAFGDLPEDIPVVDRNTLTSFISSNVLVSFTTTLSFADVVDFYKQNMPNNDWSAVKLGSYQTNSSALLVYEKSDGKATVTINVVEGKVVVAIGIQR
jgi:hypothetical protein